MTILELIEHSFEAGRRGKPDELESGIANLIGAYLLSLDEQARFDLRVSGSFRDGKPLVRLSGEVSKHLLEFPNLEDEIKEIVRQHYEIVHRTNLEHDDIRFEFNFKPQSTNLALNGKSGDIGKPIAVAYAGTPENLPWERFLAVELRNIFDSIYQNRGHLEGNVLCELSGVQTLNGLRADGKIAVDATYIGHRLHSIERITAAIEHEKSLSLQELREKTTAIIQARLGVIGGVYDALLEPRCIEINGAGEFNQGGWQTDEGTREAKSYRDGFSTYGVAEDSFSGEDPSKPSGTGTLLARHIAVSVVRSKLAEFARVALGYNIGSDEVSLNIFTNGTATVPQGTSASPQEYIHNVVRKNFPLGVNEASKLFDLRNPETFRRIATASDYFQDNLFPLDQAFPWNRAVNLSSYNPREPTQRL